MMVVMMILIREVSMNMLNVGEKNKYCWNLLFVWVML